MKIHPFTVIAAAALVWVIAFKSTSFVVNGAIILLAAAIIRTPTVLLSGVALGLSSSISMFLIWHAHGDHRIWWRVTSEGLLLASQLSFRYMAMIMVVLTASNFIKLSDFLKCVEKIPFGAPVAYIAGVSIQWIPQVAVLTTRIREANQIRGRSMRGPVNTMRFVVIPLISRMFYMSALRGIPLEISGITKPGPRTILYPVADTRAQQALRILLLVLIVLVLIFYGTSQY
ncbi:MAG: energy-coupling factor transporter transmembrane component T [Corynebacterium sp.]|nr:energy-coupling factor transporter transmembrane component T [Corynebacterium sp.]